MPRRAGAGQLAGLGRLVLRVDAPHPAVQGLLALAAYLAVFIIGYAGQLLRHPGVPLVYQTGPDPNFYIWNWEWWPYAISHGLNPLYSRQIGAPAGFNLAWTTPTAAVAVLMSPVTALVGPIASFNLMLALAAPVSAWAAFVATRRLTGRFWAALVAGAVYGLSWYEVDETGAGHPNLCVILLLPLMVYLALLWRDGKLRSPLFVALLAIAMAAEFYVFNETFVWMTVLWAALLIIGFAVARPVHRPTVARLAGLASVAWVISILLASPYLLYALRHAPASFTRARPAASLNLLSLVHPWSGIVLLTIAVALAVASLSSRLTWLLIIGLVLTVAVAAGPDLVIAHHVLGPFPWAPLWRLPFARSTEPVRIIMFVYLVLAMIVAIWLAMPARSWLLLASRWVLGLVAVAGIVAAVPDASKGNAIPAGSQSAVVRPTHALPAFFTSGEYRRFVRPGETVVVVSDRGNAGMLFQAYTHFYMRLAGGFINVTFTDPSALPPAVADLRHPTAGRERQFFRYVHQAGVGAILVEQAWAAPWMNVFSQMGLHGVQAGGVIVYRTS